ncbi:hypothetical protein JZ785_04250 [Alicyclobacillus curvatus]|nr:hypothetical protein JZ785_04250 [Alicyclobacillus curvatus]
MMISLVGLLLTAIVQAVIVAVSGSVALLADTIHNFGDALTSLTGSNRRRLTKLRHLFQVRLES